MQQFTIFEVIFLICMSSLGVRAITSKEMIFYFLRKPFDRMSDHLNKWNDLNKKLKNLEDAEDAEEKRTHNRHERERIADEIQEIREERSTMNAPKDYVKPILYIMKPFLLCSTCMASIHTLLWYPIITERFDIMIIVVALSVAYLNTAFWVTIEFFQTLIKKLNED